MRRLLLIVLSMAALAGTAAAGTFVGSDQDGTLSVRGADGTVWIKADGALVGRFDLGSIRVFDPTDGDAVDVEVWGADHTHDLDDSTTIYGGTDVRFRIVGRFRIRIQAAGIDLSVAGQGRFGLNGDAGTYALNGKARRPLPEDPTGDLTYADLGLAGLPGP